MYETTLKLSDGNTIPQLGLGVWRTPASDVAGVVKYAVGAGYRHIDTAAAYENEEGVGIGIRDAGIGREDVFVTTKLWNAHHGFDETLKAFEASLQRLQTDWVDLYLIHWPAPHKDRYVDSWKALIRLKNEGRVKSIGVSNFEPDHLKRIIDETGVTPVVNQIELHPLFQQRALRDFHAQHGITTESWSPLGQGKLLQHPVISEIALEHGCSAAQVIVRWHLQSGFIVIPKSVTPSRILENGSVENFVLDPPEMAAIDALDEKDGRIGPNPNTATF